MIKIDKKNECSGCYACVNVCPKQCISMMPDGEGFLYPQVDTTKCINCGICENVCPINNQKKIDLHEFIPEAFSAINTDEKIRFESSSGGVFTLIASWIISNGGIVFGASLTEDYKSVVHVGVETTEDLKKLRGSKYVQSIIGNTYIQAKNALDFGRLVLFTGTPCQIGGLYSFLQHDYDNLYTQDLICHGVPSPLIWKKYVELRERKAASKTRRTFFRHKKYGWKMFSVLFEFANSTEYINVLNKDIYMRGFLANLYLRPSCYDCAFKGIDRPADITLADFWGVQNVCPEMDDDKGTSLVIIHSEKGKQLFNQIASKTKYCSVNSNSALKYNSAAVESVLMPESRDKFFETLGEHDLSYALQKYCSMKSFTKVKAKICGVLSKIKRSILGN